MILDARKGFGHEPPHYDLCIVGAGAAGITLALELEAAGWRVCLLEAGGPVYEAETQRLFEGEAVGQPYPMLRDTRVGALGGSTTVWAGWCRPLEALDFEPRDWCDAGGWPFGLDELRPYYARAHEICGLAAFDYEPGHWAGVLGTERILPGDPSFTNEIFHINVVNFGQRYRERLERSKTIDLVLHAPVTRLRLEGATCAAVEIRTLGGDELAIRADRFVLAAGGIENPRLLLLSAAEPAGVPGNAAGLVGRYFTDHAFVDPGTLVLREPDALDFYRARPVAPSPGASSVRGVLSLHRSFVERERLMHAAFFFHPRYEAHRVFATGEVKALQELWNKVKRRAVPGGAWPYARQALGAPHRLAVAMARKLAVRHGPTRRWRMRAAFETGFRVDNRVMLSDERDRLGRRGVRIEWRIGEADIENMRRVTQLFDQAVRQAGVGHLERAFPDAPAAWRQAIEAGKHHMGTTRMHVAARQGVVDENGRVHGTANLFVTGSSVFPSGGYANPTLTIVALAVRLGDHLKRAVAE
ncbi:MAG TPA: GMC family oxidoreductase [Gemmatimonadales bacterium]|nr:GMC family oxidoreductase [Gemmatimonadales bacterium]